MDFIEKLASSSAYTSILVIVEPAVQTVTIYPDP